MVATYNFGSVYMNYVFCIAYVFMSFTCGGNKEYYIIILSSKPHYFLKIYSNDYCHSLAEKMATKCS